MGVKPGKGAEGSQVHRVGDSESRLVRNAGGVDQGFRRVDVGKVSISTYLED